MRHPSGVRPMKAKKTEAPPAEGENLVAERKLDGWRCLAHQCGMSEVGAVHLSLIELRTSTGKAITSMPYIEDALRALPRETVLDGELVNLAGGPEWNGVQSLASRDAAHVPSAESPALTFVVFDVLEVEGTDLRGCPLMERKRILSHLLHAYGIIPAESGALPLEEQTGVVRLIQMFPSTPGAFDAIVAAGGEGIVVKDVNSTYLEGGRKGWTKHKGMQEVDAACTGTFPGKGRLEGWGVGGITFSVRHDDGTVFDGQCAGMSDDLRRAFHDDRSLCEGMVVELRHWGVMEGGALRFPQLRRVRDPKDKHVGDLGLAAA